LIGSKGKPSFAIKILDGSDFLLGGEILNNLLKYLRSYAVVHKLFIHN